MSKEITFKDYEAYRVNKLIHGIVLKSLNELVEEALTDVPTKKELIDLAVCQKMGEIMGIKGKKVEQDIDLQKRVSVILESLRKKGKASNPMHGYWQK